MTQRGQSRVLTALNKAQEDERHPRKIAGRKATDSDAQAAEKSPAVAPKSVTFPKKQRKSGDRHKPRTKTPGSSKPSQRPTPLKARQKAARSAEKIPAAEMRKFLQEIPTILQRKGGRAEAPHREVAKRHTHKEPSKAQVDFRKKREEQLRNDQRIREMNHAKFSKRSELADQKKKGALEARARHKSPDCVARRRSASEEERKLCGKHADKRRRTGREGRKEEEKWEDAGRKEKNSEGKKRKKDGLSAGKGKKPGKKRAKSSDILSSEDREFEDFLRRLHSHSSAQVCQRPADHSAERDAQSSQQSLREALKAALADSPPISSSHSPRGESPRSGRKEEAPAESIVTADFPKPQLDFSERKSELKRRLMILRTRVEEVQDAESSSRRDVSVQARSSVSVVKAKDLQEIIRHEAAVKIQSHIRRFLAQRETERMVEAQESEGEPVADRPRTPTESPASPPKPQKSGVALQRLEAQLRAEEAAKEAEILRLREANRQLSQRRLEATPENALRLLESAKEQEISQFQELVQTKCGSRVDLVEEMSVAFERMLDVRYRQLQLLFSLNRERLQTALKTAPSELDVSTTMKTETKHEETKRMEEVKGLDADMSLDAFLRKALGTVETEKIEKAAARHAAQLLQDAQKQAETDFSSFDCGKVDNTSVASPDLSAIPLIVDTEEGFSEAVVRGTRSKSSPEPDCHLDAGSLSFPFRVAAIPTRETEEPLKPIVPISVLPDARVPPWDGDESSSDLEDLLSRPAYEEFQPPAKPQPPRPKKPTEEAPLISISPLRSPEAGESPGLHSNPFESSQGAPLLSPKVSVSEKDVADIAEAILMTLLRESIPRQMDRPALPLLDLQALPKTPEHEQQTRMAKTQIEFYVASIFQKVSESELRGTLQTPARIDPLDALGQLQDVEIGPLLPFDAARHPLLHEAIFLQVEGAANDFSDAGDRTPTTNSVIRDSQRYQHRLLFDCCNEALQRHRVYGENFAPLPWSLRRPVLTPQLPVLSQVRRTVTSELLVWTGFEVGKIPDRMLLLSSGGITEEKLQMVREEKLSKMLTADIENNELAWVDYESPIAFLADYEAEEAQVKIDLADMVLEAILDEVEGILQTLSNS